MSKVITRESHPLSQLYRRRSHPSREDVWVTAFWLCRVKGQDSNQKGRVRVNTAMNGCHRLLQGDMKSGRNLAPCAGKDLLHKPERHGYARMSSSDRQLEHANRRIRQPTVELLPFFRDLVDSRRTRTHLATQQHLILLIRTRSRTSRYAFRGVLRCGCLIILLSVVGQRSWIR